MLDLFINFLIGLAFIGIPSYFFYKIGIEKGIRRGMHLQVLREWKMGGIIDLAVRKRHRNYPE